MKTTLSNIEMLCNPTKIDGRTQCGLKLVREGLHIILKQRNSCSKNDVIVIELLNESNTVFFMDFIFNLLILEPFEIGFNVI